MSKLLPALVVAQLLVGMEPAKAASLDGQYISNMGNNLSIKGSSYMYRHRSSTDAGSGSLKSIGSGSYLFSGKLDYVCKISGRNLNCGGGRRKCSAGKSWF